MKKLKINRREFYYEIIEFDDGEYGLSTGYKTIFYLYRGVKKIKKFLLFGPDKEIPIFEEVFTLHFSVEDTRYSKKEVRIELEKKIKVLEITEKREAEIKNGDII